jgi:hypothetical protein
MISNTFHALKKDKIENIFDLSAPNVLYILLGAPSILQYHIWHPQYPSAPPITQKEKISSNLTPFLTLLLSKAFKFGMFNTMTSHLGMSF